MAKHSRNRRYSIGIRAAQTDWAFSWCRRAIARYRRSHAYLAQCQQPHHKYPLQQNAGLDRHTVILALPMALASAGLYALLQRR